MTTSNLTANDEVLGNEAGAMLPPVDIFEDASGITLYSDLPGVPKDKIAVRVEADVLSISGEVHLPVPKEMEASHAEVQRYRYQRSFTLGQELDRDKLDAEFRQGVLKLHIPKLEKAKPRRIEVRVS